MLQIYTGNGKGKTTAALGQILRALGHKKKVCLIQLFKGKKFYAEQIALKRFKNFKLYTFADKHPFCEPKVNLEVLKQKCLKSLILFKKILNRNIYDLIVLDEFNIAIRDKFIKLKDLLDILNENKSKTEIIITGRSAPKKLIDLADLVTEMKEIKHPFSKGIKARKGIEY